MRVNAGKSGTWYDSGKAKIYCQKAPKVGIEQRLLNILIALVEAKKLSISINSVDTGKHVPSSRHYAGRAVDINDIHVYGGPPFTASLSNPNAVDALQWLVEYGFRAGRENGPYDAVLLGPPGQPYNRTLVSHSTHMHVSIHAGAAAFEVQGEPSGDQAAAAAEE